MVLLTLRVVDVDVNNRVVLSANSLHTNLHLAFPQTNDGNLYISYAK